MMDEVLAIRRNLNTTWDDLYGLLRTVKGMVIEKYGPKPQLWPRSVYGPLAGILDGVYHHPEFQAWARFTSKLRNRVACWFLQMPIRNRPGYNDFLLLRWALLGDEATAVELTERAKRQDSIGCTLCWALRSLCQQYPEFRARFIGTFPKANPEHMVKDAPKGSDLETVRRRAEWIDKTRAGESL
jgi:hypothetical protein